MKVKILFLLFFIGNYSFSQSINDYQAVIIPLKYDFLKIENQYRLATLSKLNLNKAGFEAYYDNELLPNENIERCSLLKLDVQKDSSFFTTKLYIVFKDCYGKIVFQSEVGMSKEKSYEVAYVEALNKAFVSVYDLHYKYVGESNLKASPMVKEQEAVTEVVVTVEPNSNSGEIVKSEKTKVNLLYAQPTATGFQLVDDVPSVVMHVYKTSIKECYIAIKGSNQGVLILKGDQWFFEYYQNDKLISEKIEVKF
jgi:hypothetical protein